MNKAQMKKIITLAMACYLVMLLGGFARADGGDETVDREALRKRFEARHATVLDYKTKGTIGETTQGWIEAVKPEDAKDEAVIKLLKEENDDRAILYRAIAKEQQTTVETVQTRAAMRNYKMAQKGQYLKTAKGEWLRSE